MVYKVVVNEAVEKDLLKLDRPIQMRIFKFIQKLAAANEPKLLLLPYSANLAGYWKKRIGDYRVICAIDDKEIVIEVVKVGHRSKVYQQDNSL